MGILVDGAIVVVENIHRYMQLEKRVVNIICAKITTKETFRLISSENLSYSGTLSQIITNLIMDTLLHGFTDINKGSIQLQQVSQGCAFIITIPAQVHMSDSKQ
jgi:hypothetical protein